MHLDEFGQAFTVCRVIGLQYKDMRCILHPDELCSVLCLDKCTTDNLSIIILWILPL